MALRISPVLGANLSTWGRTPFPFRMSRFSALLYIVYSFVVGVFLLFLPWKDLWDNNYFVYRYPGLRPILGNPFLKGAVLGLGIVNIVIGCQELAILRKRFRPRGPQ